MQSSRRHTPVQQCAHPVVGEHGPCASKLYPPRMPVATGVGHTLESRGHSADHVGGTDRFTVAGRSDSTPCRTWPPTSAAIHRSVPPPPHPPTVSWVPGPVTTTRGSAWAGVRRRGRVGAARPPHRESGRVHWVLRYRARRRPPSHLPLHQGGRENCQTTRNGRVATHARVRKQSCA